MKPSNLSSLIPVTVLTGFLGSGKTTVLSRLLKSSEFSDTAVIINEFGEVGLDHLLVERASENLVVLNSGCLCCTVRGDLITTLRDLFSRRICGDIPAFQRVVIETTGLADPAPVLHTLMSDPLLSVRYKLDGVLTTVDAVNGLRTLDNHVEAQKQAAVADRVLLTKCDIASSDQISAVTARLRTLNPGTPIFHVSDGAVDPQLVVDMGFYDPASKSADVRRWLRDEAYADGHVHAQGHDHESDHPAHGDHHHEHEPDHLDVNRHDEGIHAFCVFRSEPVLWDAFTAWLEIMTAMRGDDLLRMKGIVNVAERPNRPVVVHGVQHLFHPPVLLDAWPSEDHRTRLVFIVRDIERAAIEDTLHLFSAVTPEQIAAAERRVAG